MKKILIIVAILFSIQSKADSFSELLVTNDFDLSFKKAYSLNPSIPKGVLEAVAFTQSRFKHLDLTQEPSCIGYPKAFGVMGLTEDGKSYFRNNLTYVSNLSGYTADDIKSNPEKNILAYAKSFSILQSQLNIYGNNLENYKNIFVALSELPLSNDLENDFAMNAHLYQLYWFLSKAEFQDYYGFPDYNFNMKTIFGTNYEVLSSQSVNISPTNITNNTGAIYKSSGISASLSTASTDYPPALWNPTTCNYSSRSGTAITMVAIHDVEGSYAGCISWFKNCSANASAHYVVRSSDGQITQMIREVDKAWHIGSENPYTLGIEHEGYNNNASWYTTAMLVSSADLVRDMCTSNGINPLRCFYGPGCSGTTAQCSQGTCVKIKGHQMFPNQTHNDPGPYWNWEKFYKYINNTPTITTITSNSGAFYDTGGASANYGDGERKLWLFQPSSGSALSLNFTSFSIESGYDHLFIYDGATTSSPLIGKYTGNVSPGSIISTSGSLLVEFRSDCATNNTGWVANYSATGSGTTSSGGGTTTPTDIIAPTTVATSTNIWQTANFTETFTDADNTGGSGLDKSFYQVIDFDGTEWRGNYTHGFFSDNFDNAIHPEWTPATGTWAINNNALEQNDEVSSAASNTNIHAALTQTLSNRYLYNFKGKISGTGSNRRAGFHFFIDNPSLPNRNNSYFVYFRLAASGTPTASVEIYKTVNDAFGNIQSLTTTTIVPNQWYDYKVIFDRTTGKIDVYQDNVLVNTWTDPTPHTVGDFISFRSGNCNWALDEIKVYRSRPVNSVLVTVGSGNGFDARYQNPNPTTAACKVKSIVNDVAGNLSAIAFDDINIDWTPPSIISKIDDGLAADINTVVTSDSLSANWPASIDPNSGAEYYYSIGTTVGATNTLTWTSAVGNNVITAKNLSLTIGQVYYFNVKAINGAGLENPILSSNGQTIVAAPNQTVNALHEYEESKLIKVFPNPFTQNFEISIDLTTDSDVELTVLDALGKGIVTYQSKESRGEFKKTIDVNSLGLSNGNYFIRVNLNKKQLYKKVIKN